MGKLTKAQLELLSDANDPTGTACVQEYRPAQKLVELGLAEWGPPLRAGSPRLRITTAGRAALEASK